MAKTPRDSARIPADGLRIAIVTSEFNAPITNAMRRLAREETLRHGATVVADVRAPGTYDIPLLAHTLLGRFDVDAVVALGAVITGETKHDELVTHAAAHALTELALRHAKPVGLGITGPGQTRAQAKARIDRAASAVRSALKQVLALRQLAEASRNG